MPVGVDAEVDSVSVEVPPLEVTGLAENAGVTPAGAPLTARVTFWAAPAVRPSWTVDCAAAPWTALTAAGDIAIEKSFVAVTVSCNEVVCVADAPVPTTPSVKVPVVALAAALKVSCAELPAVTEVGVNEPVTPAGSPVSENVTACAAPEATWVETVTGAVAAPCVVLMLVGDVEIEKSLLTVLVTMAWEIRHEFVSSENVVCIAKEPVAKATLRAASGPVPLIHAHLSAFS